ncbi:rRNA-processing protein UTP21, partial [Aspergillus clavatus NRRL 1]
MPCSVDEPISRLLVLGSWVVGCTSKKIEVWKNTTYEHYTTLNHQTSGNVSGGHFYSGQMCSMPTYLNKIFVGRIDGFVDIWNVRTGKLLYTIPLASPNIGAVTAIEASPVLSLIAVAHANGSLFIRNVDTGQIISSLHTETSHVTSMTFRSDNSGAGADGQKAGVLATSCPDSGDITMWDLVGSGRVMGVLRNAHKINGDESGSGINRVDFLDGQALLVSSGKDNALKTWIFDEIPFSPLPRQLHSRSGHSAPITALDFIPSASDGSEASGKWLLSASKDCSLWGLSVRKDSQSTEISQGAVERKAKKVQGLGSMGSGMKDSTPDLRAPEITCIACSLNRDGGMSALASGPIWANPRVTDADASNKTGWESVITGHRGDKVARTWFWGRKRAGRWTFETSDGSPVKSVAITLCGTFALIGSNLGSIDIFNLQSGQHRLRFPGRNLRHNQSGPLKSSVQTLKDDNGHTRAVTGLMVDGLNQTVVSSGLDGKVKFWDFHSGRLIDELDWYPLTAITGLRYNSSSDLVAFSCDDLSIRVVDIETRKLIREFWGCAGQINDFTFSNDSRWIVAASMDSRVRVWDLSTGHLIDIFQVPSTCTSLTMSSTGEFLATAHADSVGVRLWTNRGLYLPVSTKNLEESSFADSHALGKLSIGEGAGVLEAAFSDEHGHDEADGPVLSNQQLDQHMVTLSTVPKNNWQTLLYLDLIKERNKPQDPPKVPEKAPFFLPSPPENQHIQNADNNMKSLTPRTSSERSRIVKLQNFASTELRISG